MRFVIGATLLWLAGASGCSGCGCGSSPLAVGGAHPYYRCAQADAPEPRTWQAGAVTLRLEGRDLHLQGVPAPLRIAAFAGPAPFGSLSEAALGAVRSGDPQLVVVLGSVGDDEDAAVATLEALSALGVPTLVLAGGDDDSEVLDEAFDRVRDGDAPTPPIDARPLRRLVVGNDAFILVSGAPNGRYARTDRACGFAEDDLDDLADELGEAGDERRWLVSWAAPLGTGPWSVGRGFGGVEAGDPTLGRFARAVGAGGGIFGWPRTSVMQPTFGAGGGPAAVGEARSDLRIAVPPLGGVSARGGDGRRVSPQPAFLELSGAGLAWVEAEAPAGGAGPPGAP